MELLLPLAQKIPSMLPIKALALIYTRPNPSIEEEKEVVNSSNGYFSFPSPLLPAAASYPTSHSSKVTLRTLVVSTTTRHDDASLVNDARRSSKNESFSVVPGAVCIAGPRMEALRNPCDEESVLEFSNYRNHNNNDRNNSVISRSFQVEAQVVPEIDDIDVIVNERVNRVVQEKLETV